MSSSRDSQEIEEIGEIGGGLLLAMPTLADPNFARSAVLMIEHSSSGSLGLVINRPMDLRVAEVMEMLAVPWGGASEDCVWSGGPVTPQTGWLLHSPVEIPGVDAMSVAPGIALSTSAEQLQAVSQWPPSRVRFLMGYAGWGPGQLEFELAHGSWLVAGASPELVFDTDPEDVWESAIRSLGVEPATLVPGVGIH